VHPGHGATRPAGTHGKGGAHRGGRAAAPHGGPTASHGAQIRGGRKEAVIAAVHSLRRASAGFQRLFTEAHAGVTLADVLVLHLLAEHGPLTPGAVAKATGLTSGGVTAALDRLEEAGLASRRPSHDDRRKVLVSAAPHGRLAGMRRAHDAAEAVFAGWSTSGIDALRRALDGLTFP